jgi:RNA polymerase sigma factor (sigma-70 family)
MSMSDVDLLRSYAETGSNTAFASLVERHLNLVYSVARRHVQSAPLAEDVAQSVFIELARNARQIKSATPLAAWLHLVSRRMALNAARGEMRRHARETAAAELAEMKTSSPGWTEIEPALDEAVESLDLADRNAILLRYFESKSLREIGSALGVSEDTAQKRVSRALEQLRKFFVRRGIAVTAAGLVGNLSAHAIHSAPDALLAAVGSLSLSGVGVGTATAHVAHTLLSFTLLKKASLLAISVALVGTLLFQTLRIFRQRQEIAALQSDVDQRQANLSRLSSQRNAARQHARSLFAQSDSNAVNPTDDALASAIRTRLAWVKKIRQLFEQHPELNRPELALLDDAAWLDFAEEYQPPDNGEMRNVVRALWVKAKATFADQLLPALSQYLADHGRTLPGRVSDLAPYFREPPDPAILARYEMLHTGRADDVPREVLSQMKEAWYTQRPSALSPERESAAVIAEKSRLLVAGEHRLLIGLHSIAIAEELPPRGTRDPFRDLKP